jgi:hypothetical protein
MKGCTVSVKAFRRYLPKGGILQWKDGEETPISNIDIIKRRNSSGDYPSYEIEPKSEYKELIGVVMDDSDLIMIETRFWWKDNKDTITNYRIVDLPKELKKLKPDAAEPHLSLEAQAHQRKRTGWFTPTEGNSERPCAYSTQAILHEGTGRLHTQHLTLHAARQPEQTVAYQA